MRGERLREMREVRQLSQQELADRVGVSAQHIHRMETGKNPNPTAATLVELAKELEVSVDYLLGLVDEPQGRLNEDALTADERKLLSAWRREDTRRILELLMQFRE